MTRWQIGGRNAKHLATTLLSAAASGGDKHERQLMKKNAELRKANEILKNALGFFAKGRKR